MKFYNFEPQMGVEAYEFSETKKVGDSYEFTKLVLSYPADDFDDFVESDFMYFVTESLVNDMF